MNEDFKNIEFESVECVLDYVRKNNIDENKYNAKILFNKESQKIYFKIIDKS